MAVSKAPGPRGGPRCEFPGSPMPPALPHPRNAVRSPPTTSLVLPGCVLPARGFAQGRFSEFSGLPRQPRGTRCSLS